MADDERIGLGAMEQAEADGCVGGVEQRALPLDHVPVIGRVVGRKQLDATGHKVGDDRVDGEAATADQHASLARRAEGRRDTPSTEVTLQGKGSVFLADRAIGVDCQHALAGAPAFSRPAAALVSRALVDRSPNPEDQCSHRLVLAESGHSLYAEIAPKALELGLELLTGFSRGR